MGVALSRPSGWPKITENNSENFIDHKLLDAEGILKKYQLIIFAKKWVGKFFFFLLDNKLHDTKAISKTGQISEFPGTTDAQKW